MNRLVLLFLFSFFFSYNAFSSENCGEISKLETSDTRAGIRLKVYFNEGEALKTNHTYTPELTTAMAHNMKVCFYKRHSSDAFFWIESIEK